MDLKFDRVSPEKILPDRDFALRYRIRAEDLLDRIRNSGVVQPLLGLETSGGFLKMVSGFRRFEALRVLGWDRIPFLCVPEGEADPKQVFKIALAMNAVSEISELDKAVSIRKARDGFCFDWNELLEAAPLLGLPISRKVFEEYDEIGRMPDEILARADGGELPFKGVRALLSFCPEDRMVLAERIFARCEWSASEAVTVCEWIDEICRREKTGAGDVEGGDPFRKILEQEISRKEKGRRMMDALRHLRYPLYSKAEDLYRRIKQGVEEEKGLVLDGTSFFENGTAELHLKFRSGEELVRLADRIRTKEKLFKELFGLVK
ncbi:MAG TPA: ParB N-terminal domain-containing protein [Candidatus Omnitrophota bacterium]|nr:ParB N-terminal domain-containing protein [Candidatus Omnitrophota bacterium]